MPFRDNTSDTIELRSDPATRDVIDVIDGIDRVMGDRDLYARMLRRFHADYREGVAPIRAALAAGERSFAQRRAHTLKGSSGMIGSHRLHALASALELAIRTDPAAEQACLDALAPEFDKLLHVLDEMLARAHDAPPPALPPKALLPDAALLAQLMELLIGGDGAAVDLLEESGTSLKAILGEARLLKVAEAVNEFDYDGALRALRQTAEEDQTALN